MENIDPLSTRVGSDSSAQIRSANLRRDLQEALCIANSSLACIRRKTVRIHSYVLLHTEQRFA